MSKQSSAAVTQPGTSQVSASAGSGDRILGVLIMNDTEKSEGIYFITVITRVNLHTRTAACIRFIKLYTRKAILFLPSCSKIEVIPLLFSLPHYNLCIICLLNQFFSRNC